jgi:N-acetyl-gamma-glutamyl-phosphate reductase
MLPADLSLRIHAVSGYSGGGRSMIERYEDRCATTGQSVSTRAYGLGLDHKHVPEMHRYSGCADAPLFAPMVGDYRQGMLVNVPLFTAELGGASAGDIRSVLADRYRDEPFVEVLPLGAAEALDGGFLDPTACNDSNRIELLVFGHAGRVLLTARYDNLGKGAAGAAVQNLNLMIGAAETEGLIS